MTIPAEDAARLAALEEGARERSSLQQRRIGQGLTRTVIVHPDAEAGRLALYLDAFTDPRRPDQGHGPDDHPHPGSNDWGRVPAHRRRAWAFGALLEHLDPERIPAHGGTATRVVVSMTLDALRTELAAATLYGHEADDITAETARRLACEAQILPVVLGGSGQILDAGRSRRLFSGVQRTLIQQTWGTCIAEGCTIPARWSDVHHIGDPWAAGGRTDLADGVPACTHHHHCFHQPQRYRWERLETGRVRFHRRE